MSIVASIILISGMSLLLLGLFILCICIIFNYIDGQIEYDGFVLNKIKFQSFLSFYAINPKQWNLCDGNVIYTSDKMGHGQINKKYIFRFSFIDYIKYFFWHWFKEYKESNIFFETWKKEKAKEALRDYQDFCECIKQDIEQFKQSKPWEDIR